MKWSVWYTACSLLLLFNLVAACPVFGQTEKMDELLERAHAAQSSGRYGEAAAIYAQSTTLSPRTPELWSNRGVMEFLAGERDASIASLERAMQLNPDLYTPLVFLGKAYLQGGKSAQAVSVLMRAHSIKSDDVEVLLSLGKADADLDRPQAAASFYADAARIAPQQAGAWFGLGVSSLKIIEADGHEMATSQPQSIWAQSLYADELLAQSRPVQAVTIYRASLSKASPAERSTLLQILQWTKSNPDVLELPAASREALGNLTAELSEDRNAAVFKRCPPVHHEAQSRSSSERMTRLLDEAACAYRASQYDRSAERAAKALENSAQSAEALYWSIKANERVAVSALSQFETLSAQSAANYVLIGNLYRLRRQPDTALHEYKKALALDPHDSAALMGAVLACLSANKLEEARTLDESALADRPLDPQLNLLMAEILDAQGDRQQEEFYLTKADAVPPELQPRMHYLLGRVFSGSGRTDDAIRQYELALPGDKDGSIHYQLSRLYRKTGNVARAEKVMTDAKTLIGRRNTDAFTDLREVTSTNP